MKCKLVEIAVVAMHFHKNYAGELPFMYILRAIWRNMIYKKGNLFEINKAEYSSLWPISKLSCPLMRDGSSIIGESTKAPK